MLFPLPAVAGRKEIHLFRNRSSPTHCNRHSLKNVVTGELQAVTNRNRCNFSVGTPNQSINLLSNFYFYPGKLLSKYMGYYWVFNGYYKKLHLLLGL